MDAKAAAAHTLGQGQEYRFEVVPGDAVSVQLVGGTAEIFGAEMSQRRAYTFTGPTQEAIFTWHGCTLQVEGACKHAYVAPDTPMQSYMRLHAELEQRRASARERGTDGPRVLVAGGHGCGKGSLCRMLANYASRAAGAPVLVELGVSHGKVGFPGAVAATSVGWPLDIERSSDDTSPLAFWYGHASPQDDVAFYKQRVTKLAEGVARRLEAHPAERQSGLLISGCGWTDGGGFEALLHQVSHFRVDVIVVMADDRLHSQLTAHAAQWSPSPTVLKLPRSGGAIARNPAEESAARAHRWHVYFYGLKRPLSPHAMEMEVDAVQVYRITEAPPAPASALPIGMAPQRDQLVATRVPSSQLSSIVHSILAVVRSATGRCDDLLAAPVAGFVLVSRVDLERKRITLLSPSPLALPSNTLLAGSLKWVST